MSHNARPTYEQLEALVTFLEENPGIAKGHLRSSQAKWETKRKWEQISITLYAMGGTQKDAKGWSKFWSYKKYSLKKIGQRNADANRTGGAGPSNLPSLSCIEERMVAILGGRGFAEGDSQFTVPILPMPSQEPSTSTAPIPPLVEEEFTNFPKLENTSFFNWRFRVKTFLEERSLVETLTKIDKSIKEVEKDAKAKSVIVQCVTDKHLELIKKCSTAKEMMDQFERKSVFNKLFLRKKLISLKCGNKSLQNHFFTFDKLVADLEATGCIIDQSDKVCHLFLTLPEQYDTVITTLETMTEEKELTLDFVKARLMDAEMKINEHSKEKGNDYYNDTEFVITCYKCGKKGHKAFQCKTNTMSRGSQRERFQRGYDHMDIIR
ncbi:hypothetical protein evm_011338 [Chilo suppressalis]|nr:hypothetical protein evm_011338 [Chilo suppressalis]